MSQENADRRGNCKTPETGQPDGMKLQAVLLLLAAGPSLAGEVLLAPHRFRVAEGYVVEKCAGPPLVDRPVNMALDESGALYVTDSSGSNAKPEEQVQHPTHRIRRLTDENGDGLYDRSTVFADRLSFPEGAMWLAGSLYVAAPPVILKFTDTNADGASDVREVWYDGGTLTGCANDLHGPYAGPDGYIYWCKGAFAEQRHRLADGREFISRASHIFRARPDGSGREVVMGGGMDNPVDLVFTAEGERFLSNTFLIHPGNGQRDGILHAVYGGLWGKVHGVLDGHPRTGELLPVMTHLGPAAPSGLECLRGNSLGMQGHLICAQFNMRKVSAHRLQEDGATWRTTDTDLLVSDQADFHPTDVIEDADGSLLVADTGGWYKLCCPTSQFEKPEVLGAIYRIRREKAERLPDPLGTKLNWGDTAALPALLSDARHAVADRAARTLSDRQSTALLAGVLGKSGDDAARLRALWALTRIATMEARLAVRGGLSDAAPAVRTAAAASAALWRDGAAAAALLPLLRDASPRVQRAAAEALGRTGGPGVVQALLQADYSQGGRFAYHSAAMALYETATLADLPAEAPGMAGDLAKTVRTMLTLPRPAAAAPLPLITPAAPLDAEVYARQRKRLAELALYLPKGDAARGGTIFQSEKSTCTLCHAVQGKGGKLGPDLTRVGAIRAPADLLEAIVFPSSSYVRSYEPLLVKLRGSDAHLGILKDQTATHLTLAETPATEIRLEREKVESLQEGPYSLMPAGFDGLLTPEELADVVAWLAAAR